MGYSRGLYRGSYRAYGSGLGSLWLMGLGRPWVPPLAMEHPPPTSYQDILRYTWASSDRAGLSLGEGTVLPASTPLLSSYRGLGGLPKLGGTFYRDPDNKDHNMLGARLGFPFLGNSQQNT